MVYIRVVQVLCFCVLFIIGGAQRLYVVLIFSFILGGSKQGVSTVMKLNLALPDMCTLVRLYLYNANSKLF